MLRFLSNYIFQNENQPNENDPNDVSEEQGPTSDKIQSPPEDTERKEEFMDLEMREDGDEGDDDWVLIGEKKKAEVKVEVNKEVTVVEDQRVQEQPVNLVAAEDTEEDEEEDSDDEEEEGGIMWENKLIEHPSMSVYVDMATSLSEVASQCTSFSSIAPATSPGESVIVLEQPDSDDDESMDFVESVFHEAVVAQTAEQVSLDEDEITDPSDIENKVTTAPTQSAAPQPALNGRRKKGHYPCPSTKSSSQLPRRAHLRSTATFVLNGTPETVEPKRAKRSTTSGDASVTTSACGIAIVNGPAPAPTTNGMINKNLKLVEMFPTASAAAKRRHNKHASPKSGTTPGGHFLQEAKRRQDLQNHTKRSFVNNDRRSAQQRRVQKTPAGANSQGGRK